MIRLLGLFRFAWGLVMLLGAGVTWLAIWALDELGLEIERRTA